MSSRALRKAQKAREQAQLQQPVEDEALENESDDDAFPIRATKPSAFALLNINEDSDDNDENDDSVAQANTAQTSGAENAQDSNSENASFHQKPNKRKNKKKKNKKNKPSATNDIESNAANDVPLMDETEPSEDVLNFDSGVPVPNVDPTHGGSDDFALVDIRDCCNLLSIELRHLNFATEMRRLFGRGMRVAEREDQEDAAATANQQPDTPLATMSLADAVNGNHARDGPGLPDMIQRRNMFRLGNKDWPKKWREGLSMEIEFEDRVTGIVFYRFVHDSTYQQSQVDFNACVRSLDPNMMIALLQHHPYHVATLLQVSEMAIHYHDFTTSGMLLERALFSFGTATHSTFAEKLSQGKARLDFKYPENREFYLTCWKYIDHISKRATWRTAYEWLRLILSLDPISDPYCVRLRIDQLALRAKEADSLLALCNTSFFKLEYEPLVNIQFSRCLAMIEVSDHDTITRMLVEVIEKYPWVARRLFEELNIEPIPAQIWGTEPPTNAHDLYCELYVDAAKDLWRPAEATALLRRAASASRAPLDDTFVKSYPIEEDDARYAYLTGNRAIRSLIPKRFKDNVGSENDPMPPENNEPSYDLTARLPSTQYRTVTANPYGGIVERPDSDQLARNDPEEFIDEIFTLQMLFQRVLPGFVPPAEGMHPITNEDVDVIPFEFADGYRFEDISDGGLQLPNFTQDELYFLLFRYLTMRVTLVEQPRHRVTAPSGAWVTIMQNGWLRMGQ